MTENDILPHLALKNFKLMHDYLQQRLKLIDEVSDLIPFIKHLLPINNLKIQISSLLHQEYMKHINNDNSNNEIRSLFISLCSLSGIPSDDIHAKILSFLPSNEYRKLPILSRHFRDIFRNYPNIYNLSGYSINIYLKLNHREKSNKLCFNINHKEKIFEIDSLNEEDDNNHLLQSVDFPFDKINIWIFGTKSISLQIPYPSNISYGLCKSDTIPFNALILDEIVLKSINSIQSVQFVSIGSKLIEKDFKNKNIIFNHCIVARISNSIIIPSIFCNLQYLELWNPIFCDCDSNEIEKKAQELYEKNEFDLEIAPNAQYNASQMIAYYESIYRTQITAKTINKILQNVSKTLLTFVYKSSISMLRSIEIDPKQIPCGVVKIPLFVEWISIKGGDYVIDLTDCKHIIGMQLSLDIRYNSIIWPSNNHIISYLYVAPMEPSLALRNLKTIWKDIIYNKNDKLPPIKFVCFGKFAMNDTASTVGFSWASNASAWSWGNRDVIYDDDIKEINDEIDEKIETRIDIKNYQSIKRVKINDDGKYNQSLCLVLDKNEINQYLFGKIMNYTFNGDENIINNKIETYKKWYQLHAAHWIYGIGNLNTLERFA